MHNQGPKLHTQSHSPNSCKTCIDTFPHLIKTVNKEKSRWLQRVIVSCKKKKKNIYIYFFISIIYFRIFYYIITNSRQKVLSERLTSSICNKKYIPCFKSVHKIDCHSSQMESSAFSSHLDGDSVFFKITIYTTHSKLYAQKF